MSATGPDARAPSSSGRAATEFRSLMSRADDPKCGVEAINRYVPRLPQHEWVQIEAFVRELARAAAPRLAPANPVQVIHHLAHHIRWACVIAGFPQEVSVVLRLDVIEAGLARTDTEHQASLGKRRAMLRRVGEVIGVAAPAQRMPLSGSRAWRPCTAEEVRDYRGWALSKRDHRRRSAQALLGLGFGAGLASREIGLVRCADLVMDEDRARCVQVADRTVPIAAAWQNWLGALIADRQDPQDAWLFESTARRDKNLIPRFVHREGGTQLGIVVQRMRASWLVERMQDATVVELLTWSGVSSLQGLARYDAWLPRRIPGS